jgi:COMPASS component SWD2
LLTTNGSVMRLIDAFNGNPLQTFAGHLNNKGIPVEGSFSPDSQVQTQINNTFTLLVIALLC